MAGKAFKRAQHTDTVWFEVPGPDDEMVRFDCIDDLPGGVLLDFGSLAGGEQVDGQVMLSALTGFFLAAINPDQYEQWTQMIRDPRCGIGMPMMTDIAAFLGEQYSGGRPTGAPSAPISSKTESGNGSTDGALREVATYSRSTVPVPTH